MKFLVTIFVLLTLQTIVLAQNNTNEPNVKFGEVSLDELRMKVYDKDSTAAAVVLYEYGETMFGMKSMSIYTHFICRVRIKVFKKSASKKGDIVIVYRNSEKDQQMVTNVKGVTYNEYDGQIKKEQLTKEMIFDIALSKDLHQIKFSLPNIKDGSIIEYSYEVKTPFIISHNPMTWYFQSDIPTVWSEYRIKIPVCLDYQILLSGYLPLYINQEQKTDNKHVDFNTYEKQQRFVIKNAPAFSTEPFVTSSTDFISKVDFELATIDIPNKYFQNYSLDYKSLSNTLLDSKFFGAAISENSLWSSLPKMLKQKSTDSLDQIKAAYDYIKENFKWNSQAGMYIDSFKKTIENRKGDSGEINWMLISLLQEMGFDANPLILSTRSHGRIDENFAILKRFNYVVAHVMLNGKDLLLDATDEHLPMGVLPFECLNHIGFLVHEKAHRFVSLEPTERAINFNKSDFKINEDGELTGVFVKTYGGYNDWSAKKEFKKEGKEKFLESVKKAKASWNILKADFINFDNPNATAQATYELITNDFITKAGNLMYLKPMISEGYNENPFKTSERNFPIDMAYQSDETFISNYEIPAGFRVEEMPKSIVVNLPNNGGRFSFVVTSQDNKVSINSRIQFRKSVYPAEEYDMLREFYDKIVAKHNEQIVLKKN